MPNNKMVFSFDVGKASLGVCVRQDSRILDLKSLLIPAEFAMTSDFRGRRRAMRTRLSHKKREQWLIQTFQQAGLETFEENHALMTREFSKRADDTLYNSALLRVALLQNKPLEPWQIFKALWASIQHRGYDPTCNWKPHDAPTEDGDEPSLNSDEKENLILASKYNDILNYTVNSTPEYLYPCYLEASLMGLWSFEAPELFNPTISYEAEKVRTKGRVAPRELVEKEVRALFENAKQQLPSLALVDVNEFLYGPGKQKYASLKPPFNHFRGTEWDTQGVLSQKVPCFDNRIIGKCQLFSNRNTCKAKEPLNLQFKLLQKLKLYKFTDADGVAGRVMTSEELNAIFRQLWPKVELQLAEKKPTKINKTDLANAVKAHIGQIHNPNMPIEEIKLQSSGRARFSRPALRLMIDVMLSGTNQTEFDITPYVQTGKANPLTRPELEAALSRLGETWKNFYVGDKRYETREINPQDRQYTIQQIISECNNPIVRNRLTVFWNELKNLAKIHGEPEKVILEFVRGVDSGLEGSKTAKEWEAMIGKNEAENDKIRQKLQEAELSLNKNNLLRMKLFEEQQGFCPYSGERLDYLKLSSYDIDHIVPVSNQIATDAYYNTVLCTKTANSAKGKRSPYEWFQEEGLLDTEQWEDFIFRVTNKNSQYGKKKRKLLTQDDSRELIDSYNGLAETAYIAKLARQIVTIQFGWPDQTKGDERRVFVNDGKVTAKIRQIEGLNTLLLSEEEQAELKNANSKGEERKIWKKNRGNKKHHALDAYCISYSQQLVSEQTEDGRVHWYVPRMALSRAEFEQKLQNLFPASIRRNKKEQYPLDTIYGLREYMENGKKLYALTVKKNLESIVGKERKKIKDIFDTHIKADLEIKSAEITDANQWKSFLKSYRHPKRKSKVNTVLMIESVSDQAPKIENGRFAIGELKDFGKGETRKQFKRTKANQGQIIYFDAKGKPKVAQVYAHKSLTLVKQELEGFKLYNDGQLFYAGCTLNIPKTFSTKSQTIEAGLYKLRTIMSKGTLKFESDNGKEYEIGLPYLVDAGFYPIEYHNEPTVVSP